MRDSLDTLPRAPDVDGSGHTGRAKDAVSGRARRIGAMLRDRGLDATPEEVREGLENAGVIRTLPDARDGELVLEWLDEGPASEDKPKPGEMKWRSFQDAVRKARVRLKARSV